MLSERPFNYSARLAEYEPLMQSAGGAAVLAQLPADEASNAIGRSQAAGMVPTIMVTTADRSDEEVYDVTRAIFENRQELVSTMPGFDVFYPDALFDGIDIPLHPAAERFWATQGLLEHKEAK